MEYMFMPLKRYAEFSGRSRRMEYWMWVLFQFLIGCAFLNELTKEDIETIVKENPPEPKK